MLQTSPGVSDISDGKDFVSIIHILERRARETGDDPAVCFFPDDAAPVDETVFDSWSWKELRDRAAGVAVELTSMESVTAGSRVLLVYPAGLAFTAAFYGCLYAGAVPIPVPTPRRAEGLNRWLHIARDAGISGILCPADLIETFTPLLREVGHGFCIAPSATDPAHPYDSSGEDEPPVTPSPDHLAFLQYTSGSTSDPKGVMVSHGNLMANLHQMRERYELSAADRMVSWLPHYHDMGLVGCILTSLHNGYPLALMSPASFLRRPLRYLALATHFRATIIGGPNFAYEHCVEKSTPQALEGLDLSTVRVAFNGAETIRPNTLKRFHATFAPYGFRWEAHFCCYGMAEATLFITGNRPDEAPYVVSVQRDQMAMHGVAVEATTNTKEKHRTDFASSGRHGEGLDLAIVDPDQRCRVDDGTVGEVWVKGANISSGYWNRVEQNLETFDQVLGTSSGWFRTGDLGFLREDQLYITGRLKDMILIRGQNHYPQDIEQTVYASHSALAEGKAGAFAFEIDGQEQVGVVCEVSRKGLRDLDAKAVFSAIRATVSRGHELQLAVVALIHPGSLPMTPSGKVRRFACREGVLSGELPTVARWDADTTVDQSRSSDKPGWLDLLRTEPSGRRIDVLRRLLSQEVGRLAGLPAEEALPSDVGFFDLGLDSVAMVNFGATLERELNIQVDTTLMFEHPTLGALAKHLAATLFAEPSISSFQTHEAAEEISAPVTHHDLPAAIAAELAALQALLRAEPPLSGRHGSSSHD